MTHARSAGPAGRRTAAGCARVCLIVLDGWGLAPPGPGNAVSLARTPVFDELWDSYPHTTLTACGRAVGLPEGQMGNSEVGHLNLGAGAVVRQDLVRIDDAVADGSLRAERDAAGGVRGRRACPPARARLRRRRALLARSPARADRARARAGGEGPGRARVHRRARHAAARGRGATCASSTARRVHASAR